MAADKKLAQIAVHVSDELKGLVSAFAESEAITVSEYVHALIEQDIQRKKNLLRTLSDAFARCDRTVSGGERP